MDIIEFVKGEEVTIQQIRSELTELNKQTIATKGKKAEELIANIIVCTQAIEMMGDIIYDQDTEIKVLKKTYGDIDTKFLEESNYRQKAKETNAEKNKIILQKIKQQSRQIKSIV